MSVLIEFLANDSSEHLYYSHLYLKIVDDFHYYDLRLRVIFLYTLFKNTLLRRGKAISSNSCQLDDNISVKGSILH